MATPSVPPRPTRASNVPTTVKQDMPYVPPRPIRKTDSSPDRENFTRSPLNALPGFRPPPQPLTAGNGPTPRRPSSINLPSDAGQEGSEYSSFDQLPDEAHGVDLTTETLNVAANVPLHAPKASVPASLAKKNIAKVTRNDAPAGFGKEEALKYQPETHSPLSRMTSREEGGLRRAPSTEPHPLRNRSSFSRSHQSLPGTSRPPSMHGDYDGIPEIGRQIPLYPNAGDVQAPSPGPGQTQYAPGIGFFNDGSTRAHHRKRSSRHEFQPPDSYGLHGHGMEPQDHFERDWAAKHPNEAARESVAHHLPRPPSAMSTEQLNKLVLRHEDVGMGTNREMISTPTQEIAFDATDKYTQKVASPRPTPAASLESSRAPLAAFSRKQSFPFYAAQKDAAGDNDDDVIHVDETSDPVGKMQPERQEPIERSRTPILADDEVLKRPGSAYMLPAVSADSHYDDYYDSDQQGAYSRRSSVHPPSRPSSRPGSVHGQHGPSFGSYQGGHLHRHVSHEEHNSGTGTPLAEIEEYEPLFPDDDTTAKPKIALRMRPSLTHHFPSQDIWEDTPSSLQYQAEVDTPDLEPVLRASEVKSDGDSAGVFETPAQEQRRKSGNTADMLSDQKTFIKPNFKPGVRQDVHRPGVYRFPSQDIWEDTPDSMRLETTVNSPQMDSVLSPPEERPTTAALPLHQDDPSARSTTSTTGLHPQLPERSQRRSKLAHDITDEIAPDATDEAVEARQAPAIPDRPKPTIPTRPARSLNSQQQTGNDVNPAIESDQAGAVSEGLDPSAAPKAKPVVPARPGGGKIAALKAGFMNDLNNRLQLGPQGLPLKTKEIEAEPAEEEKAPLADARKSRARGPPRRKPASPAEHSFSFSFCSPMTLWQINESDEISVSTSLPVANIEPVATEAEQKSAMPAAAIGAEGDLPEPSLSTSTLEKHEVVKANLEESLAQGGEQGLSEPVLTSTQGVEHVTHDLNAPALEEVRNVEAAESEHVV